MDQPTRRDHTVPLAPTVDVPGGTGALGRHGEDVAATHLADDDGLEVVARNWRLTSGTIRGELDIVALDHRGRQAVICEVKTRRGEGYGGPLLAVTARKQARIRRLTGAFLRDASLPYHRVRLDVVAIWLPRGIPGRLTHLHAAF